MLGTPTTFGVVVIILLLGLVGAAVGVVMTAVSSAVMSPTRWSFTLNMLFGGIGYVVGWFASLAAQQSLDNRVNGCGVFVAVLVTATHEIVRWVRRPR
jgi:hypothetical protein